VPVAGSDKDRWPSIPPFGWTKKKFVAERRSVGYNGNWAKGRERNLTKTEKVLYLDYTSIYAAKMPCEEQGHFFTLGEE
jgi:hypothetical protein